MKPSQKTPLRVLTLLLATALIACGYLLYRVQSMSAAATAATSTDTLKGLKLSEDVRVKLPTLYSLDSTGVTDVTLSKRSRQQRLSERTERLKRQTAIVRSMARQLRLGGVPFVRLPKLVEDGYGFEPASEDQKKARRVWLEIKVFYLDGKYIGRARLEIEQPFYPVSREFVTLWSIESHREFVTTSEKDINVKTEAAIREIVNIFIQEYRQANNLPKLQESAGPHWADSSRHR